MLITMLTITASESKLEATLPRRADLVETRTVGGMAQRDGATLETTERRRSAETPRVSCAAS